MAHKNTYYIQDKQVLVPLLQQESAYDNVRLDNNVLPVLKTLILGCLAIPFPYQKCFLSLGLQVFGAKQEQPEHTKFHPQALFLLESFFVLYK